MTTARELLQEARQCVHKEANDEREIEGRGYYCDLASRIDAFLAQPEPAAPAYCPIHQHYKWCEHNGGVLGETGYGPSAKPEPSAEALRGEDFAGR